MPCVIQETIPRQRTAAHRGAPRSNKHANAHCQAHRRTDLFAKHRKPHKQDSKQIMQRQGRTAQSMSVVYLVAQRLVSDDEVDVPCLQVPKPFLPSVPTADNWLPDSVDEAPIPLFTPSVLLCPIIVVMRFVIRVLCFLSAAKSHRMSPLSLSLRLAAQLTRGDAYANNTGCRPRIHSWHSLLKPAASPVLRTFE